MAYSVFPERMDKLNVENPEQSFNILESYINYMQERVEFSLTNMYKTVQGAGVSSAEMLVLIAALSNSLSAVTATVNQVQATVTGLQTTVGQHTTQLASDQQALTALRTDVNAAANQAGLNAQAITTIQGQMETLSNAVAGLNTTVGGHTTDISNLQNTVGGHTTQIADLDARVTALEGGN